MSVQRVLAMLEARIAALEDQSGRTNRPQSDECRQMIEMLRWWPSDPKRCIQKRARANPKKEH